MKLTKIVYNELKAKQQEVYNRQKLAGVLADYGYEISIITNDTHGADFIAVGIDGSVIPVQLKGRLTFDKKYLNKNIYIAFPLNGDWYIVPHDEALERMRPIQSFFDSPHWANVGQWSWNGTPPKKVMAVINDYKII